MDDLLTWIARFQAWCYARGLSPRYVTRAACRNSRLIERMELSARKHARNIRKIESWMADWDEKNSRPKKANPEPHKTAAE